MARYEKLGEYFYSMDLLYGKTNLKPHRDFYCFFIIEQPHDEEFIRKQALQLIMSQCKNFHFYGAHSSKWDIAFDEADISVHSNEDDWAMTSWWDNIESFVDALDLEIGSRPFIPRDIYLIYDDVDTYKKVLSMLRHKTTID